MKSVALLVCLLTVTSYASTTAVVSIEPMAYLVGQIGKEHVKVSTLIKAGQDPHTYSPTPSQVKSLNSAKIFFHINAPFEKVVLKKIGKKGPSVVALDKDVKKRKMEAHHHHDDHHNEENGLDPHIWLSHKAIVKMVSEVEKTLAKHDPVNAKNFKSNKASFLKSLKSTVAKTKKILKPLHGKEVLVFHPAFGYFLDEYGLKQETIEIEGKLPTAKHIGKIIAEAKKHKIRAIFVQPQFSQKSARKIAKAIGGKVETMNALSKSILKNFIEMATTVSEAYSGK